MYEVSVRRHFDAAHALRGYKGKCENMHGHRYEVVASFSRRELDQIGLAMDFGVIKAALDAILDELDHHCLNDLPMFAEMNPSSENLARFIYERLDGRLPGQGLNEVTVFESPDAWVRYTPDSV